MKNILRIVIILSFYNSIAQAPIINRYGVGNRLGDTQNAYYKDTENFRDQFVGTWIYTNGNTMLKVEFQKRDMVYSPPPRPYYKDYLVGEFQYIENGVEKANTLDNLNTNYTGDDIYKYNLLSGEKYTGITMLECDDCPTDVVRLQMSFDEPANDDFGLSADFVIRHVVENGVEKLKVQFIRTSSAFNSNKENPELPSTSRSFSIPYGNYTLIKQ